MNGLDRIAYLHGFASSPRAFKGLHLQRRFAALGAALELPDLNRPSFPKLTVSAALDAFDALDDGRPWRLVGSSMGGYLAARFAQLHPERVRGLVLLCPGFDLPARWRGLFGEAAMARWERTGTMRLQGPEGALVPLHWGFIEDARRHPAFPEVPCPTLILHGLRDEVVPIDLSREYARARPHVRLVELDDDHGLVASVELIAEAAAAHFGLRSPAAPG